ncbi:MAG: hypothetical protein RugAbin2_00787 [Rugosibacter sp.]|jgi:hypothetical protein|nr:hypothetical protein [Rugosibacter sp.]
MNFSQQDFKKIQWALLLLISCLLMAGLAAWLAINQQKVARQEHINRANAEKEMAANLTRARSEEQELRDKITRFETLKKQGIVGNEQRLEWVELINQIKNEHHLAKLDYEFSPQRKADAALVPEGAEVGGLSIMASQMRLSLSLLHEGELINVLDELHNQAPAWVSLRSCQITRHPMQPEPGAKSSANATIDAECTLEWLTIKSSSNI